MAGLNKTLDNDTSSKEADRKEQERAAERKGGRLLSLKNMLIAFIALCWGIPVLLIFISFYNLNQENAVERTRGLMKSNVVDAAVLLAERINGYITDSKRISYQMELESTWKEYDKGSIAKYIFRSRVTKTINKSFQSNLNYIRTAFITLDGEETIPYMSKQAYTEELKKEIELIISSGSYAAHPIIIEGRLFIIRNLYTTVTAEKYGTLVIEVNTERLTRDMGDSKFVRNVLFSFDERDACLNTGSEDFEEVWKQLFGGIVSLEEAPKHGEARIISVEGGKYEAYAVKRKENGYVLHTFLLAERKSLYSDFEIMKALILSVLLVLIPIVVFAVYFIKRHVTHPIDTLVDACRKVRAGDMDTQIDDSRKTMPNREFSFLMVSFNRMSAKIKYLFDYAYNEQLARKDAQIMALQSQINPHFLNNTLEMMNWQARMSGDIAVSKMIEALSTLLGYSMDRSNARVISLAEEIRCADAYLYIISMRFGQRLLVEKQIDESLLQTMVPGLILQPLLENAVVHGIEKSRHGKIWLKVFREGGLLLLQVLNTGNGLALEDEERIKRLLDGKEPTQEKGRHTSLGIKNVNERIKLIYGREYGLSIRRGSKDVTEATIKIPYVER